MPWCDLSLYKCATLLNEVYFFFQIGSCFLHLNNVQFFLHKCACIILKLMLQNCRKSFYSLFMHTYMYYFKTEASKLP